METQSNRDDHPETPLEKILKEKFGVPDFGNLMHSIVDTMLDGMNAPDRAPETGLEKAPSKDK